MNKTDRKNRTNLVVTWPTNGGYFEIKELKVCNPEFKDITLRVRLDKAIKKDKIVTVIGSRNSGKGRPTMVMAMAPVTQELLEKAYKDGIQPPDSQPLTTMVNITNVTTPISISETPTTDISMDVVASTETVTA